MFTAIIPLRKGSKGLPGKNIRLLNGKALYLYTLDQAIASGADKIVISTDIPEVIAGNHPDCVIVLPRPLNLCSDTTTMAPVLLHAIQACDLIGNIVLMQVTSPLRRVEHLEEALKMYASGRFDLVMSVAQADSVVLKWGTLNGDLFEPLRDSSYSFTNRQLLPEVVKPNGAVYVLGAEWFLNGKSFVSDRIGVIRMSAEDSCDIDTLNDFNACEKLLLQRQRGLNNENC